MPEDRELLVSAIGHETGGQGQNRSRANVCLQVYVPDSTPAHSSEFAPGRLVIVDPARDQPLACEGRCYGVGEPRAMTFAIPGIAMDVLRVDWQKDASLTGKLLPPSEWGLARSLSTSLARGRSGLVRRAARQEIVALFDDRCSDVSMDVEQGFEHLIPADMKGLRRRLLGAGV